MPASEQGVNQERYRLIPRTLIFLRRGERVLLLKGAAHKRLWAGRYNGLGGHIERGEDPQGAAERELLEETGLTAQGLRLVGVAAIDAGENTGVGLYIFSGECPQGEPAPSSEGTAEWVALSGLGGLPLMEDLHQLLPRVLNRQPGDPPFSAAYHYDAEGKMVIQFHD